MLPALLTGLVAAAIGALLGLWTRRTLATLNYRLDDEEALPTPGPRRWIIWVSALSLGSIASSIAVTNSWTLVGVLLPLTLTGPALAAIDQDVMRLPNRILGPVAFVTLAGLVGAAAWRGTWTIAVQSIAGAFLAGGTFWLLNWATHGGVGFGDVKLASLVGLVAGAVSLAAVWWAVALGTAGALIWARVRRREGPFAYGPSLLTGTLCATLAGLGLG